LKHIEDFAHRFGVKIILDQSLLVESHHRYFLLKPGLKELASRNFISVGLYLGRTRRGKLSPSFNLLRMIAREKSNKTFVDERTAWLFICGRDIFARGIMKIRGRTRRGDYTLICNHRDECLGFGEMLYDDEAQIRSAMNKPVISNILDIGDFLRREK